MRKEKYAECIVYLKRYIQRCKYRISKLKGFGFHYSGLAFWDLGYSYFMVEDYFSAVDAYRQAQILMPEEKGIQQGIECCLGRITVH